MWQKIKFLLKQSYIKKYCAIAENDHGYVLAAVQQQQSNIVFENFCFGTLNELAASYKNYPLAISIDPEQLIRKTWFYPKQQTLLEIYLNIAKHESTFTDYFACDIELIDNQENPEEILVIAHLLSKKNYLTLQQQYQGFQLAAIEPVSHVHKRLIDKVWQQNALDYFQQHNMDPNYLTAVETALKLLDRNNFYENIFS